MSHRDFVENLINLLADTTRQLASQATPEAAREIRENVKLLVELSGIRTQAIALDDLEERLCLIERGLFGDVDPEQCIRYYETEASPEYPILMEVRDAVDDVCRLSMYLDVLAVKHLGLREYWKEDDDMAGE